MHGGDGVHKGRGESNLANKVEVLISLVDLNRTHATTLHEAEKVMTYTEPWKNTEVDGERHRDHYACAVAEAGATSQSLAAGDSRCSP